MNSPIALHRQPAWGRAGGRQWTRQVHRPHGHAAQGHGCRELNGARCRQRDPLGQCLRAQGRMRPLRVGGLGVGVHRLRLSIQGLGIGVGVRQLHVGGLGHGVLSGGGDASHPGDDSARRHHVEWQAHRGGHRH